MAELFEVHDSSRFELIAFSFGPSVVDDMSKRVSAAFDRFIDVSKMTDAAIAQLARSLGIDIAVDLKGYTKDCRPRIFDYGCAPVQVNYLGYPGTMGASCMDYIVADRRLIPEGSEQFYDEKVVFMPQSYMVNDSTRRISERPQTRAEWGLPDDAFVFCCFNNNHKILPETFASWMRIMQAVDGSVLWLLQDNPQAAANLRREAEARGVAGSRLIFAPRAPLDEHLARHRLADLFIDSLPYNAHTTTSDALWAGLPVLTCAGKSFASRVAASLVHAVGLPELIVSTSAAYETLAIALARDPGRLAAIRRKLADNRLSSTLFNARPFARAIEAAYQAMHERCRAGLPPVSMTIRN